MSCLQLQIGPHSGYNGGMETVNLRLYQVRLAISLLLLLASGQLEFVKARISFVMAALTIALAIGLLGNQLISPGGGHLMQTNAVVQTSPTNTPQEKLVLERTKISKMSFDELQAAQKKTQELLSLQPTHFDLLINAYLLDEAMGNYQSAQQYLTRAKLIDPNNEIFQ